MGLAGVIFDLDGVLVSTDRLHFQAWRRLAQALDLPFDEEVNHHLRGVSREDSLRAIYRSAGRPQPAASALTAQCNQKNTWYVELIRTMSAADVLPGTVDLLHSLRDQSLKIAIASASRNCRLVLDRTGLTPLVDAICDGTDTIASKPDPEVFYLAARRLGLNPLACVGIEDAPTGLEAIRRAGMAAIGIGPAAIVADARFHSIAEVTPGHIAETWLQHQHRVDTLMERSESLLSNRANAPIR